MLSGPICAMVWEGKDAVKTGRVLLGYDTMRHWSIGGFLTMA
jgi:nucleoside diphosphate kinase